MTMLRHTISNSRQRNKKYNGHKGDIPNSRSGKWEVREVGSEKREN